MYPFFQKQYEQINKWKWKMLLNLFHIFQVLTYAELLIISQIKSRFSKNDLNIVNDGRKEPIHTKEARADRNQGVFNVVKIIFLPFPSKV